MKTNLHYAIAILLAILPISVFSAKAQNDSQRVMPVVIPSLAIAQDSLSVKKDFRPTGWHGSIEAAGGIYNAMITVNGGYQLNRHIYTGLGGGMAFDGNINDLYAIFYADLRTNVAKGNYAPFFDMRFGIAATSPSRTVTPYARLAIGMNVCRAIQLSLGADYYGKTMTYPRPTLSIAYTF